MLIKYVYACGEVIERDIHPSSSKDHCGVKFEGQRPIEIYIPLGANESFIKSSEYAKHPLHGKLFIGETE